MNEKLNDFLESRFLFNHILIHHSKFDVCSACLFYRFQSFQKESQKKNDHIKSNLTRRNGIGNWKSIILNNETKIHNKRLKVTKLCSDSSLNEEKQRNKKWNSFQTIDCFRYFNRLKFSNLFQFVSQTFLFSNITLFSRESIHSVFFFFPFRQTTFHMSALTSFFIFFSSQRFGVLNFHHCFVYFISWIKLTLISNSIYFYGSLPLWRKNPFIVSIPWLHRRATLKNQIHISNEFVKWTRNKTITKWSPKTKAGL